MRTDGWVSVGLSVLVGCVAVGSSAMPRSVMADVGVAGRTVQEDPSATGCLTASGVGVLQEETVTNNFHEDKLPAAFVVEHGGSPIREKINFATELDEAFVADPTVANFEVEATLTGDDNFSADDAAVVTATAVGEKTIQAQVCLDPLPPSGELAVGEYTLDITFTDERIPEISVTIPVRVGSPSVWGFWAMVVGGAVVAALALIILVVVSAGARGESPAHALTAAKWWLGLLIAIVSAAVVLAGLGYQDRDTYDIWTFGWEGITDFAGYARGWVTNAVAFIGGLVILVPQFRQGLNELIDPSSVPAARSQEMEHRPTKEAPPYRGRMGPPSSRRDSTRGRLPPLAFGLIAVGVAAVVVVGVALSSDDGDSPPPSTITINPTTIVTTSTPTVGSVEEAFASLDVGTTQGEIAVQRLRAVGFPVFDYLVCSTSVPSAGILRAVRVTETGADLLDQNGLTVDPNSLDSGVELDVLITNGEACL